MLPRLGTISPWSSKATDIAHHCGLTMIERIERGVAYHLQLTQVLSAQDRQRLMRLLHDRMTESVFYSLTETQQLFQQFPAKPLQQIDISSEVKMHCSKRIKRWDWHCQTMKSIIFLIISSKYSVIQRMSN